MCNFTHKMHQIQFRFCLRPRWKPDSAPTTHKLEWKGEGKKRGRKREWRGEERRGGREREGREGEPCPERTDMRSSLGWQKIVFKRHDSKWFHLYTYTSLRKLNSSILNQWTGDSAARCIVLYSANRRAKGLTNVKGGKHGACFLAEADDDRSGYHPHKLRIRWIT